MAVTPKYRALTTDELTELRNEFIEYLVVNGITAEDWKKLKTETPKKAEDILTLFSDVVFESILRKVDFLEKRMTNELMIFQCLNDRMVLVGITSSATDFTKQEELQKAVKNPPQDAKVYTTEKVYNQTREMEVFQMLESGCMITDGKLFKALSLSL